MEGCALAKNNFQINTIIYICFCGSKSIIEMEIVVLAAILHMKQRWQRLWT